MPSILPPALDRELSSTTMLFRRRQVEFEQAVRSFNVDLYRYAYVLARDRFIAEDLVQETFARAWKAWDSLKDGAARKFWLISILRNENARRFARRTPETLRADHEDLPDRAAPPAWGIGDELEALVDALPLTFREPLILQVLGGYTCAEIAALLHTTEGAIMTRLTRARQTLRAALRQDSSSIRKAVP